MGMVHVLADAKKKTVRWGEGRKKLEGLKGAVI